MYIVQVTSSYNNKKVHKIKKKTQLDVQFESKSCNLEKINLNYSLNDYMTAKYCKLSFFVIMHHASLHFKGWVSLQIYVNTSRVKKPLVPFSKLFVQFDKVAYKLPNIIYSASLFLGKNTMPN